MDTDAAVTAVGVEKAFGDTQVLRGLDLTVEHGSVLALLGPNGAGKTTTVRILSTLLKPDRGRIQVAGYDVLREPNRVRAAISLTGQYAAVDELLTGEENLRMIGRLRRLSRADARRRARELLERFDLVDARGRLVKTYSGGMRRRLDIAASLIGAPRVLFLDEPTTGLDPRSRQVMWDMIRELTDSQVTILLTTQYLEEADHLADRIAVIDGGRVIAEGSAAELKARVGAEHLRVSFPDHAAFQAALRNLGSAVRHPDPTHYSLELETDGSAADIKRVLDRLFGDGIPVTTITSRRPSLDDVFLTLTGRSAKGER